VIADGTELESALEVAIAEIASRRVADPIDASTIPAAEAELLASRFGLESTTELALAALPVARRLSRPPISGYRVPAVGIEAGTGDLLLGGNLEFPGTELGTTIHAEGFVTLRARRRGRALATLALRTAHPCAHCRQVLAESASADRLVLVDAEGARLRLADLYPWPFRPASLGVEGDEAGRPAWPGLAFVGAGPANDVAEQLLAVGARAHAPYSGAPSAAVLRAADGRTVAAGCLESVAFNPSISALQAALVELAAARIDGSAVTDTWLACTDGGAVDPEPGFRALLAAVAPAARIGVARWRTGA
jgi:cytidine deaminase